jgi:hypothetical protein
MRNARQAGKDAVGRFKAALGVTTVQDANLDRWMDEAVRKPTEEATQELIGLIDELGLSLEQRTRLLKAVDLKQRSQVGLGTTCVPQYDKDGDEDVLGMGSNNQVGPPSAVLAVTVRTRRGTTRGGATKKTTRKTTRPARAKKKPRT